MQAGLLVAAVLFECFSALVCGTSLTIRPRPLMREEPARHRTLVDRSDLMMEDTMHISAVVPATAQLLELPAKKRWRQPGNVWSQPLDNPAQSQPLGNPELPTEPSTVPITEVEGSFSSPSCTELINHGSYFSSEILVGSNPGKRFDVVADTGSDAVIVTSCQCKTTGSCSAEDRCFDVADSSTLQLNQTSDGKVPLVVMAFGSGEIEAIVASDKVKVGALEADMANNLLLMVDKVLDITGTFEGILGLGIPDTDSSGWMGQDRGVRSKSSNSSINVQSFLEVAGVNKFQICFLDSGNGTLLLNSPSVNNPLPSVGVKHWGLDFRGISVGTREAEVQFCTHASMTASMVSPCGAIPDSGTTLMMGPQNHLTELYEEVCDTWTRCSEGWSALPSDMRLLLGKSMFFEALLLNCSEWGTGVGILDELPNLHFHLRGRAPSGGTAAQEVLEFTGNDYIEIGEVSFGGNDGSGDGNDLLLRRGQLSPNARNGEVPEHFMTRMQNQEKNGTMVCLPAFGAITYTTAENGPVWILGTPLFYAFQVGYDLGTTPPAIGIEAASCSGCAGAANLVQEPVQKRGALSTASLRSRTPRSQPRKIRGPVRVPRLDVRSPL